MKILHLDTNHELLINQLSDLGFVNDEDYTSSKENIILKIQNYQGIVIRSRFEIDKPFLDKAKNLKFIARVGAGLENIDCDYALKKGIRLIAAPEGMERSVRLLHSASRKREPDCQRPGCHSPAPTSRGLFR